ncbi:ephrin-B2a-like [Gadus morhua]|uniref:Ephrin-B2a-like n=1 Tax=Gadus morhua TaxID=8049 RepID=A0A8C4YZ03_GADMO|nr:ephrin-B2a-like [Gadus morhua]
MESVTCSHTILILFNLFCPISSAVLESIYWNSSNTKFEPGRGLVLYPQIGDKMNIVCPRAGGRGGAGGEEFYRVYLVTRTQLQSCTVDQSDTPLLACDKPQQDVKFTFKFQEYSPNLWGLEFLKGRDYYITSTSTGSLQGMGNAVGGVCRSRSMSMVLRVGQSPSDPPSVPQESPTRFPPKEHNANNKETTGTAEKEEEGLYRGLLLGVVSGGLVLVFSVGVLVACVWRRRRPRRSEDRLNPPPPSALPLQRLGKRDSTSSEDLDPQAQLVFPLRGSEGALCRHYQRVSGDYGAPVYIVQEVPPQSPTHIYYKV